MKKGQVAMEFMSLMILAVIMSLVIFVSFLVVMNDTKDDQRDAEIKEFGFEIQREVILASQVHDGYSRTFTINTRIGKMDYTLQNNDYLLVLTVDENDYPFRLPRTIGNLTKGSNTISNSDGVVYVE